MSTPAAQTRTIAERALAATRAAPDWFLACILGAGLFCLYLATGNLSPAEGQVTDVTAAALPAWQLAQHGSTDLSAWRHLAWVVHINGHWVSNRFPGTVLWAVPFYWLLGTPGRVTLYPAAVAAATASAIAMAVVFLVLREFCSRRVSVVASLLLALGTATWTVSADTLWTHGPDQLALSVAALGLARRRYALTALGCVAAILIRPHTVVIAAIIVAWLVLGKRQYRNGLLVAAGAAVGGLLMIAYNAHTFGGSHLISGGYIVDAGGHGPERVTLKLLGALVSPARGILILSPFLLFLIPGLRRAWRESEAWVRVAAVAGVLYGLTQVYLMEQLGGDGFYGNRVLIEPLTLCTPLLVASFRAGVLPSPVRLRRFVVAAGFTLATFALAAAVPWGPSGVWNPWATYFLANVVAHTSMAVTAMWTIAATAATATVLRVLKTAQAQPPAQPRTTVHDAPLTVSSPSPRLTVRHRELAGEEQ